MFKFFKIFQNIGSVILFIFLESIALFLIVKYNKGQSEIFLHSSNELVSDIVKQRLKIKQSLDLNNQLDKLHNQNAELLEELVNEKIKTTQDSSEVEKKYSVIPGTVINVTIHTLNNYITLDKGSTDGIEKSMGVIGDKGVIGVINQVSDKYSTAISMLNINLRISASIVDKEFSGFLNWTGEDYMTFYLKGIPKHADIVIGDEVMTSGYSSIFPKGIKIGTIESYEIIEGGAFYEIKVKYFQDLSLSSLVYIIKNNDFDEINELESLNEN